MKQLKLGMAMIAAAVLLSSLEAPALSVDGLVARVQRMTLNKAELALSLRDYGMWREEHDRNTFPTDMPKAGEPYDPVTGNAIRREEP